MEENVTWIEGDLALVERPHGVVYVRSQIEEGDGRITDHYLDLPDLLSWLAANRPEMLAEAMGIDSCMSGLRDSLDWWIHQHHGKSTAGSSVVYVQTVGKTARAGE